MTDDMPATNRKAADRLHDIRRRINELRNQEDHLRRGFITGALDPVGDEYAVTIETKLIERIDLARIRRHVAERIQRPFVVDKMTTCASTRERAT